MRRIRALGAFKRAFLADRAGGEIHIGTRTEYEYFRAFPQTYPDIRFELGCAKLGITNFVLGGVGSERSRRIVGVVGRGLGVQIR